MWERLIRVNRNAPFLLTRAVVPVVLALGKSSIVNTASGGGSGAVPRVPPIRCPGTGSSDSPNRRRSSSENRGFASTRLRLAG